MATVLFNHVDLFGMAGINVAREQLYNATVAMRCDTRPTHRGGVYFAVRTVDKDASNSPWDVYIFYAPGDGRVLLHHRLRQGTPDLPKKAGAVAMDVDPNGNVLLAITEDRLDGALFPTTVLGLSPWNG